MKFVPSIITVYLPRLDEIVDPESIYQAPSIPETPSIHKFVQQISYRGDCIIKFFKTVVDQETFHTQWYNKASDAVCGHEKSNKSDSEIDIQKARVNSYNVSFLNNGSRNMFLRLNLIFHLVSEEKTYYLFH